jgi:hypothetical protein
MQNMRLIEGLIKLIIYIEVELLSEALILIIFVT